MTSPGSVQSERSARKEFVRDRQRMVFTIAVGFLAVCLLIAGLVASGLFKSSAEKQANDAATNFGVAAPCAVKESKILEGTAVTIRVLNGTQKSGIATAAGKALNLRGFVLQGVSDWMRNDVARTEIRFGKKGIQQAYSVRAQFNDALLRMDDRNDELIDVIIGATFSNLNDPEKISQTAGTEITSVNGCVDASTIQDLPQATKHNAVNSTK